MLNKIDTINAMRDLSKWNRPVYAYASLDDFLTARSLLDGIHAISYHGVFIELNLHCRPSKAMLIFFNAALASRVDEVKLPIFSGAKALESTDTSILMVSDPGLYLDRKIRLAWYAGAAGIPLQKDLSQVLQHIQRVLAIERIVLYGASGGGFAALFYAPFLKNAIAVPCNPQINLLTYSSGILSLFLESAFGYKGTPTTFATADVPDKPVVHITASHMSGTRILYIQNALDERHLKRDCIPFLQSFGVQRGTGLLEIHSQNLVSICGQDWGEGHRAPPAAFVYALLQCLTEEGGWDLLPALVPTLYARTANRLRQVTLSVDKEGFHAQAWLREQSPRDIITLKLYRGTIEVETIRVASGESGRFAYVPAQGHYQITARIPRNSFAINKSWIGRLLDRICFKHSFDEMKSRVLVVN
jgi:hypothetical protein